MPSKAATDPQLWFGPYIIDASNCTTPSSFGSPPYPTDVSLGSSSVTFADFSIASNSDPFLRSISQPGLRTSSAQSFPLLQRMIGLFIFLLCGVFVKFFALRRGKEIPREDSDLINFLRSIIDIISY